MLHLRYHRAVPARCGSVFRKNEERAQEGQTVSEPNAEHPAGREAELARLAEHLPVVLFRLDRHLRWTYASPAARALLGVPPENFIGRTAAEAGLSPDVVTPFESVCRNVLQSEQSDRIELEIDTPTGRGLCEWRLYPERD